MHVMKCNRRLNKVGGVNTSTTRHGDAQTNQITSSTVFNYIVDRILSHVTSYCSLILLFTWNFMNIELFVLARFFFLA